MRLVGGRVVLRDWVPDDDARLAWSLAPQRRWHETNGPYFGRPSDEDAARQLDGFRRLSTTDPATLPTPRGMLGVEDAADGVLVGMVTWYWEDERTDWRRLGVVIHDEHRWGRGLGTEAMALWTSYLFDRTDALRLDFATYSGNPGMLAVGQRLGFVEEGRFRSARRWSGGVHDAVVMGVLRGEWEGLRGSWPFRLEP